MQYFAGWETETLLVFSGGWFVAARIAGVPVSVSWAAAVPDGRVRAVDAEPIGPGRVVPDGGR